MNYDGNDRENVHESMKNSSATTAASAPPARIRAHNEDPGEDAFWLTDDRASAKGGIGRSGGDAGGFTLVTRSKRRHNSPLQEELLYEGIVEQKPRKVCTNLAGLLVNVPCKGCT